LAQETQMTAKRDVFWAKLDALGPEQVKENLASGVYLSGGELGWARAWVERSNERTSAEQLSLARRAADEARAATAIARTALRIAVASMIITVIGIAVSVMVPHWWH
jgi:hypothetical protein